jgi:competence protein ComEA
MTRQEQRTLLLLLGIVVVGVAIHQWRGERPGPALVIDARSEATLRDPSEFPREPSETSPPAARPALIDINTATATELMTLPGVGEARSRDIIAHREAHGPFRTVEELDNVSGIGPGILARVRPHVTVSAVPASPPSEAQVSQAVPSAPPMSVAWSPPPAGPLGLVNVNTAAREELMTLPGIGEVLAQRILDHRAAHGPFRRPEDLLAIPRIGERTLERLRPLITF